MSLYNEIRPKTFDDILGNEENKKILKGIIRNKSYEIRKQYMFSSTIGGVGKTTAAMIFSKAINCENTIDGNPCNNCKRCIEHDKGRNPYFIKLNGAEYNQVDKIKPIIEMGKQKTFDGTYRVIVIDEVQRMSNQAISEFLDPFEFGDYKTVFILTTTNVSSVPQPVLSRLINLDFTPPSPNDIIGLFKRISPDEDVTNFILSNYDGSVRDLLSKYEKYKISGLDVPKYSVYDDLSMDILKSLVNGSSTVQFSIMQYEDKHIYKVPEIFYFWMSGSDYKCPISDSVLNKMRSLIPKKVIKDISKDFLKYKPSNMEELSLFLSFYDSGENKVSVETELLMNGFRKVG